MIKDSDIYVVAGLLAEEEKWTYRSLGTRLNIPHAMVQRALERLRRAGLYSEPRRGVHGPHLEELSVHGLRFVAPAELGPLVPGIPAAWAAEPMASAVRSSGAEPPPVWPHPEGRVRGQAVEPLHPAAPEAIVEWPELGRILALFDSLRFADPRIRKVAAGLLAPVLLTRAGKGDE